MKNAQALRRLALGLGLGLMLVLNAAADTVLPPIIQSGFALWPKGGPELALEEWQKGGLLDGDTSKTAALTSFFKRVDRAIGNYQTCDLIENKAIGRTTQILYVCLNFERGAVYGKFVLYRSEKTWVVQNMDFSTRPEAIMPWLAVEGGRSGE